ncbi:MAG TPA: tyrosine-type recombinase/integrase [Bradyrhizobium sp.]|jgi:integrase|uniref:tyrosine-type recombinase/integrase n=1 Tax=Bradyrhizobium sp. TaxID=376 RepID=UPI002C69AC47|nr:tyrosine-type recombinase/integrase [Bradyrhizobium sp.]HXB80673.1 tyrosine-type recombinase/integrase [Bradyrhizobium sp.]
MSEKIHLRLVSPTTKKRAVNLKRLRNAEYRSREHLTPAEVRKLIEAARGNRHRLRDGTMVTLCYRHALRASEVCELEWSQVSFDEGTLYVRRAKNGKPSTHPLRGDELRMLRKIKADQQPASSFVFTSERGGPFSPASFNWMVKRAGKNANLPFQVHAHMLRHSAGYKLANDNHNLRAIQDWMGHKQISHTTRYTELSPNKFRDFWR